MTDVRLAENSRGDIDIDDVTHDDSTDHPRRLDTGHHSNDSMCSLQLLARRQRGK